MFWLLTVRKCLHWIQFLYFKPLSYISIDVLIQVELITDYVFFVTAIGVDDFAVEIEAR